MAVCYHEKLTMQTILCILLATSGILLLYNMGDGETLSPYGTAMALAVRSAAAPSPAT